MNYFRQIYTKAPRVLEVPPELQDRPVEIIILTLDEHAIEPQAIERDVLGWPVDFFTATAGQWAGDPLMSEQPTDYETRLDVS